MTKVIIFENKDYITGFKVFGHSGYAESGSDIVCSAISTATQMAAVGVREVLGMPNTFTMNDGFLELRIIGDAKEAQTILVAMKKTIEEISKEYSKFVKLEVKKDVY